jgi:hypothetical protein
MTIQRRLPDGSRGSRRPAPLPGAAVQRPSTPPTQPRREPTRCARCPATRVAGVHHLDRRRSPTPSSPSARAGHRAALRPELVRGLGHRERQSRGSPPCDLTWLTIMDLMRAWGSDLRVRGDLGADLDTKSGPGSGRRLRRCLRSCARTVKTASGARAVQIVHSSDAGRGTPSTSARRMTTLSWSY